MIGVKLLIGQGYMCIWNETQISWRYNIILRKVLKKLTRDGWEHSLNTHKIDASTEFENNGFVFSAKKNANTLAIAGWLVG